MSNQFQNDNVPILKIYIISTGSLSDSSEDKAYWHSRTPYECLEHIEILRRMNYGDQATRRLQRVFEITQLP